MLHRFVTRLQLCVASSQLKTPNRNIKGCTALVLHSQCNMENVPQHFHGGYTLMEPFGTDDA
jgi:hypothetical protein